MTSNRLRRLAVLLAGFLAAVAGADEQRASVNYTLHCQGCHLADASGLDGEVPVIRNFAGYFTHSPEGRAFLVRVPGVATASLPDDQLAELLNWLLRRFSAEQLPERFVPYTVDEVAALRHDLLADPVADRKRILEEIAGRVPALASAVRGQDGR